MQRVGDGRLKTYLYHIPPVAVVGITPGLVERLLKAYPNAIAGMKDSSGDWNNTKTFLDAFNDFDVFVGSESFLLAAMRNGGVGTISATANVNPAAIPKLYEKLKAENGQLTSDPHSRLRVDLSLRERMASSVGNSPRLVCDRAGGNADADLERQQAKLNAVRDVFSGKKYSMIAALKQAIAIYEKNPTWAKVRPPLVELTAEQARTLAAELKAIGFTMPGLSEKLKREQRAGSGEQGLEVNTEHRTPNIEHRMQ